MTTTEQALRVTTRAELADFIDQLRHEAVSRPQDVENETLEQYLEAVAAYVRDLPGFVRNASWPGTAEQPTWALIAAILAGAVIYE